jgi:hypothetical protein
VVDNSREVKELQARIKELEQMLSQVPTVDVSQPSLLFEYKTLEAPKGGEMDRAKHRIKTVSAMVDVPAKKYQAYLRSVTEQQTSIDINRVLSETYVSTIRKPVPSLLEGCMDAHNTIETETAINSPTKRYAVAYMSYNTDIVEASHMPSKFMLGLLSKFPSVEDLVDNYPKLAGLFPAEGDSDKREILSTCLQSISNALVSDINDFIKYSMGIDASITYIGDWYELIEYLHTVPEINVNTYMHALKAWVNIRWEAMLESGAWEFGNAVVIRRNFKIAALDVSVDEMGLSLVENGPQYVSSLNTPIFHSFLNTCYSRDRNTVKPTASIYLAFKGGVNLRVWVNLKDPTQFVIHLV